MGTIASTSRTIRGQKKSYSYSLGVECTGIVRGVDENGVAFSTPSKIKVWLNRSNEQLASYALWTAEGFSILLYIYTGETTLMSVSKVTNATVDMSGAKNSDRHHYEFVLYKGTPTIGSDNVTVTLGSAKEVDRKWVGITDNGSQGEKGDDGTSVAIKGTHYGHYATTADFEADSSAVTCTVGKKKYVVIDEHSTNGTYHWLGYKLKTYAVGSSPYGYEQADLGDGWIYDSNGHLYVAVEDGWNDVGEIRGVGIKCIDEYYGVSTSSVIEPTSYEKNSVPAMSEAYPYLWSYTITSYTDGTSSKSVPRVINQYTADGNGIASITQYYAVSSSNTTAPTSWQTSMPAMSEDLRYLWSYTHFEYTLGGGYDSPAAVIGVYGESATSYEIITDDDVIYYDKDGNITPTKLQFRVAMTVGSETSMLTNIKMIKAKGLVLEAAYEDSSAGSVADSALTGSSLTIPSTLASSLTLNLYKGSQLVAKKVIGRSFATGCLRLLTWSECPPIDSSDTSAAFQFYDGKGTPYADVVIHGKDSSGRDQYWMCRQSHTKTLNTEPGTESGDYWIAASQFDLVATRLLIAERAKIENLVAEDIYVEDPTTGQPTCYISSSGLMTEGDIKASTLTLNSRKLLNLSAKQIAYLCGATASNAATLAGTTSYNDKALMNISLDSIQLPTSKVDGVYGTVPAKEHTVSKALMTLDVGTSLLWLPQLPAGTAFESKIMVRINPSSGVALADYLQAITAKTTFTPLIFAGASYDNTNGYVKVGIGADIASFGRMMRTPCWPGKYHLIGWHEQLKEGDYLVWKRNDSTLVYEYFYDQGNFYYSKSTSGTKYERSDGDTLTRVGENVTYWSVELVADSATEEAKKSYGQPMMGGNSNSSGGICVEVYDGKSNGPAEYQTTLK